MKKHTTKLLTILLALAMLLPVTAQAAPTGGWTDEAEQAYLSIMSLAFSSMGRFPRQVMRNVFSRRIFLITAIKYIIASVVISVILDKSKKIES